MNNPTHITAKCCCVLGALICWSVGCAAEDSGFNNNPGDENNSNNSDKFNNSPNPIQDMSGQEPDMGDMDEEMPFIPEQEEFLVKALASTSSYVFVPNSSEDGNTVARIDGRDYTVKPLIVGLQPTEVRAAEIEGVGAVAYVLCEGSSSISIIRADALAEDGKTRGRVNSLKLPGEVNALTISPDGRHALAYIDPNKPLLDGTTIASLQTMALIRLGDTEADDQVHLLSVTRLIRDIEWTEDGKQAFVVGREGVNRLVVDEIQQDSFIGPMNIGVASTVLPPSDLEIEVSRDGSFMVSRTSQYRGLVILDINSGKSRLIDFDVVPTDIDLFEGGDAMARQVLVTLRDANKAAILNVDDVLATDPEMDAPQEVIALGDVRAGLAQITPMADRTLLYSSLDALPVMGVLAFDSGTLKTYPLRNQIRSVAMAQDGQTAVVIHRPQNLNVPQDTPQLRFRAAEGLTLFHLNSGYQRPITLPGQPIDLIMTQDTDDRSIVYVMLHSQDGVLRLDMQSARTDFLQLPRQPLQLGVVAGKIFVAQDAPQGRITFVDVSSGERRTVSGYELNAGIE